MPEVAKLKKKAADFELKKQFDRALAVYVEILDGFNASDEEVDVSLFNRVGDLYLKQGSVGDAVDYYEQAVDRYAEGGFHNNAIALCNKILRNSPGRASVYYKLGKISAQKGFKGDAKKNFLEYADRMQASGRIDEAFRALKEFADLCPDQDDIRLMLAEQLSKQGRGAEAIEQLQLLYVRYAHEGRDVEARATVDRMKQIDPSAEPRELGDAPSRSADDLVFLDLNDSAPPKRSSRQAKRAPLGPEIVATGEDDERPLPPTEIELAPIPSVAVQGTPAPTASILDTPELAPAVLDGVTRAAEFEQSGDAAGGSQLDGLEATSFSAPEPSASASELLDFEPTSMTPDSATPTTPVRPHSGLLDFDLPAAPPARTAAVAVEFDTVDFDDIPASPAPRTMRPSLVGLPMLIDEDGEEPQPEDDEATIGGDLQLIMPEGTPGAGTPVQAGVPDHLPLMDLELPMPGEATAGIIGDAAGVSGASDVADDFGGSDLLVTPPRQSRRQSTTVSAEHSVDLLQALSEADPDNHDLRRRLAEAMLESGDREGGLRELEATMVGFERNNDLAAAAKLADEIVLLNPSSVRHHQKRVEYAFRTNERGRLIEAYLQLADALFRAGQVEKSRAIYQRVIDLSPDDLRAQAALESFPEPEPEATPEPTRRQSAQAKRQSAPSSRQAPKTPAVSSPVIPPPVPDDEFINLGDWLREDEAPKDMRMVVDEKEPTGDEEADFQDMLKKFKQGISENVEEEDHQSHYDLGVAYKEMGLLDEAIAEFQKALRAPTNRVPTYEALGLCFIEKQQYPMASTILARGLSEPGISENQLVGVLYLLGLCAEERGQRGAAIEYYQRVFVIDIQFRDVAERLAAVEGATT